jgi:osmotically-inducible protein OsmY
MKTTMQTRILLLLLMVLAGCSRTSAAANLGAPAAQPVHARTADPMDSIIADQVRQALLDDRAVAPDTGSIRVESRDRVVALSGYVSTEPVRQRAGVLAKAVGSVAGVENRLAVDPEAARKSSRPMESAVDRAISERVRQAFAEDRTLASEASAVGVRTQDGVVRLSGTVSSAAVRSRMGVVANAVGSVKRVQNDLAPK